MCAKNMAALVIDNGSDTCKAGFVGHDAPRAVLPSLVALPKSGDPKKIKGLKDYYVGDEANSRRESCIIRSPIERGVVANWEDMEKASLSN